MSKNPFNKITLYHFPATRSSRVKWILRETVGDDFELTRLDLYKGAQYRPDYLQLNPNHNVPLLEIEFTNGETLRMIESAAMVSFLADALPEKNLAPAPGPTKARADYLQMLHFGATQMDMCLWQVRVHEHILTAEEKDQRVIDRYRKKLRTEIEPQLLARLNSQAFICGEDFTAADCIIGHNVFWARAYGECQDEAYAAYLSRLSKREAFQRTFDDLEGFELQPPSGSRPGFAG
jgi:glutathione S-transferase